MYRGLPFLALFALLSAGSAHALTVSPTFVDQGLNTTTAQSTRLYRADLVGLGLSEIAAVTITDSNVSATPTTSCRF